MRKPLLVAAVALTAALAAGGLYALSGGEDPPTAAAPGELPAPLERHSVSHLGSAQAGTAPASSSALVLEVLGPSGSPLALPVRTWRLLPRGAGPRFRAAAHGETDGQGALRLALAPGRYLVVVDGSSGGLQTERREVSVPLGGPARLEVTLARELALQAQVVNAATGAPVPLATVKVAPQSPDELPEEELPGAQSDAQGNVRVGTLGAGDVRVDVEADGHAPLRGHPALLPHAGRLRLALRPAITVDGFVLDEAGAPAPGAQVTFFTSGEPARSVVTGEGGGFAAEVAQGTYRVVARRGTLSAELPEPLSVLDGQSVRGLTLRLGRAPEVRGKVVDARSGEPVAGAELFAELPGYAGALVSSTSAGDGSFALAPLAVGTVMVHARAPGYAERVEPVTLSPGERAEQAVALHALGGLTGKVHDAEGAPLMGVTVRVGRLGSVAEDPPPEQLTGEEGRFTFSGLTPGEVRVTFTRGGQELELEKTIRSGELTEVDALFERSARLQGAVLGDTPGSRLRVSAVSVASGNRFMGLRFAQVVGGRYELELQPGDYQVFAQDSAVMTALGEGEEVTLAAGEIRTLDLTYENERPVESAAYVEAGTLGAAYETQAGVTRVTWLQSEGPAARGGLRVGDLLLAVDGEAVRDGVDAYARTSGAPGSKTRLSVRREGADLTLELNRQSRGGWAMRLPHHADAGR